jgi:hypothetical protein
LAVIAEDITAFAAELRPAHHPVGFALEDFADGDSSLTRGSALARLAALEDASPEELLRATEDPANAGARFEEVRVACYRRLEEDDLLAALGRESSEPRRFIYTVLSLSRSPSVYPALAKAFEDDVENRRFLGSLLWKQPPTVDLLVRRMVETWESHRGLANAVLTMLRTEYISVRPEQLEGAPDSLRAALGNSRPHAGLAGDF